MMRTLLLLFLLLTGTTLADVTLLWQPRNIVADIGDSVALSVFATARGTPQPFDTVDLVATWDPDELRLTRHVQPGPGYWDFAGYPVGADDPDGFNSTSADGDVFFRLVTDDTLYATASGLRLATFYFRVIGEPSMSIVGLQEVGGQVGTAIYHDHIEVTGAVAGAGIAIGAGSIDLGCCAIPSEVMVGERFWVVTLALSADGVDQPFAGADLVFNWDPQKVDYVDLVSTGPYPWLFADFFDDAYLDGWNDSLDDGDAFLSLWATPWLGLPIATPEGVVLAVFEFEATAPGTSSIELLRWRTDFYNGTGIYDEEVGNLNILSSVGTATINVETPAYSDFAPCLSSPNREAPAGCECMDFDGDDDVYLADFAVLQRAGE